MEFLKEINIGVGWKNSCSSPQFQQMATQKLSGFFLFNSLNTHCFQQTISSSPFQFQEGCEKQHPFLTQNQWFVTLQWVLSQKPSFCLGNFDTFVWNGINLQFFFCWHFWRNVNEQRFWFRIWAVSFAMEHNDSETSRRRRRKRLDFSDLTQIKKSYLRLKTFQFVSFHSFIFQSFLYVKSIFIWKVKFFLYILQFQVSWLLSQFDLVFLLALFTTIFCY